MLTTLFWYQQHKEVSRNTFSLWLGAIIKQAYDLSSKMSSLTVWARAHDSWAVGVSLALQNYF